MNKFMEPILDKLPFIESGVHVCVVARAVMPNLAPVLDRRFNTKQVVLVHTDNFLPQAKLLQRVLRKYQIKSTFFRVASAFDIQSLRRDFERLLLSFDEGKPLVNISAGTKPMSLVLFEQARLLDFPVYYMNMDDSISWLYPVVSEKFFLEDRIKLPPFLLAHGLEVESWVTPLSSPVIRQTLETLVAELEVYKKAVAQLNFYAYSVQNNNGLVSKPLTGDLQLLHDLCDLFKPTGLFYLQGNRIHFKDEEARFFANGGWLEVYLFHQLKQASAKVPQMQDNLCGVEVSQVENQVKNEIDNLVLCNNSLCIIECKTKRFKQDGKPDGGAVQSIYKLETLMKVLGGTFAKGMVVSIFGFSQKDKERAEQLNIQVVGVSELKNIQTHLVNWLNSPNKWT